MIPDNVFTSNADNNGGNFGLRGEGRQGSDIGEGGVININNDIRLMVIEHM